MCAKECDGRAAQEQEGAEAGVAGTRSDSPTCSLWQMGRFRTRGSIRVALVAPACTSASIPASWLGRSAA
jgi:hypothetical protein